MTDWIKNLQPGDRVWYKHPRFPGGFVPIIKVGRKYAYFVFGWQQHRINPDGTVENASAFGTVGEVYRSREEWESILSLTMRYPGASLEQLRAIAQSLEVSDG